MKIIRIERNIIETSIFKFRYYKLLYYKIKTLKKKIKFIFIIATKKKTYLNNCQINMSISLFYY